ncbi:DUF982 domain-containing protein [Mesorhizobium sp. B263B2A]|uniref:DUF982 domain-containing protein n=1 Tax=Mesorhizobium sp. B263B2A TaxID=2876669 RepID=UPI002962596D|nr:DUF982 domain-containing protein [Mesorhizobium sp. B263B2A]
MIAGRLRECLRILRWEAADLAAELGRPQGEIAAWLDGRSRSPFAVAAWLEALVKAHRMLPAPGRGTPALDSANIGPANIGPARIELPRSSRARSAVPNRRLNLPYKTSMHPVGGGPRSPVSGPPQVPHNREEAKAMNRGQFEEPVTVLVGMGFPVAIENVMEAYALLQDWPAAGRNGAHAIALNACKAGIAGEIDPETVRATLVTFARRNDILVQDMVAPAAALGDAPRAGELAG